MDYSIKKDNLIMSLIGKRMDMVYYYQLTDEAFHESVYMVIDHKIVDLSNSEHTVSLHNAEEDLTYFTISESKNIGYHTGEMVINKKIENIIITNEIITLPDVPDYSYITTKAITFILEDMIMTIVRDSWADEGLRIIYGKEWEDRIKMFHSNIYDESESRIIKTQEKMSII